MASNGYISFSQTGPTDFLSGPWDNTVEGSQNFSTAEGFSGSHRMMDADDVMFTFGQVPAHVPVSPSSRRETAPHTSAEVFTGKWTTSPPIGGGAEPMARVLSHSSA